MILFHLKFQQQLFVKLDGKLSGSRVTKSNYDMQHGIELKFYALHWVVIYSKLTMQWRIITSHLNLKIRRGYVLTVIVMVIKCKLTTCMHSGIFLPRRMFSLVFAANHNLYFILGKTYLYLHTDSWFLLDISMGTK